MPTIPDASRIDRSQFSGQQRVVQLDTRGLGDGLKGLGVGAAGLGRDLREVEIADRRSRMSEADLGMTNALEKERNAYDRDEEYGTIHERSQTSIEKARETYAAIIDPRDLDEWNARQEVKITRTNNHLGKVAWVKETKEGQYALGCSFLTKSDFKKLQAVAEADRVGNPLFQTTRRVVADTRWSIVATSLVMLIVVFIFHQLSR